MPQVVLIYNKGHKNILWRMEFKKKKKGSSSNPFFSGAERGVDHAAK